MHRAKQVYQCLGIFFCCWLRFCYRCDIDRNVKKCNGIVVWQRNGIQCVRSWFCFVYNIQKKLFFESYFKNSDCIGNQSEFSFSSWTCLPFASMASCVFVNLDFTSWKLIYRRPDEKVELNSDIGSSHPFVGLAFKLEVRESNLLHINVMVSNIFYEIT